MVGRDVRPHVDCWVVGLSSVRYAIFVVCLYIFIELLIEEFRSDEIAKSVSG